MSRRIYNMQGEEVGPDRRRFGSSSIDWRMLAVTILVIGMVVLIGVTYIITSSDVVDIECVRNCT